MIGRRFQKDTLDAMIFQRCNSVHSMWMSVPLDLIFLNSSNEITGLRKDFRPWSIPAFCRGAVTVIELPAGTIEHHGIEIGDHVDLNAELSEKEFDNFKKTVIVNAE